MVKVYVMPDTHPPSERYAILTSKYLINKAKDNPNGFRERVEIGTFTFDSEQVKDLTWNNFYGVLKTVREKIGIGDYEDKARLIKLASPDVLFIEGFKEKADVYSRLAQFNIEHIDILLGEHNVVWSSRMPVYRVCKAEGIEVIPIDSNKFRKRSIELEDRQYALFNKNGFSEDDPEVQKYATDFMTFNIDRSIFMLDEIETIANNEKTFIALIGEGHYRNMKSFKRDKVQILHINDRLAELGLDAKYNII